MAIRRQLLALALFLCPSCLFTQEYHHALIRALGEAHSAALAPLPSYDSRSEVETAAAMIYAATIHKNALRAGMALILPYRENTDSLVRESAAGVYRALKALADDQDTVAAGIRRAVDHADSSSSSARAQSLSDMQVRRRVAVRALLMSTVLATHALVTRDSRDSGQTMLMVPASELAGLRADLRAEFGTKLEPRRDGTFSSDYAAAAKLLSDFFAQSWRTRRE